MSNKVQLSVRVDPDIIKLRDELIEHFSTELSKPNASGIVAQAIKEMHKNYKVKSNVKSDYAKRLGAN
jgi:hypothetical protein